MRVCMANDHFYRSSGAAIAIKRIAQALTDVDYFVAGCENKGYPEDLSWIPAKRYKRFDLTSSNPAKVILELIRFRKWFSERRCDLVHCHHRRVSALLHAAGIPVLYTGQLVFPNETWFRWVHPQYMTAITPSVAENLFETTGKRPVACIGNPVRFPDVPPPIDIDRVRSRATCVARLEAVKGHRYLLAAWKLLYERGHRYELDLIGEGSLRPELERQVRRDGTQELVRFRGYSSHTDSAIQEGLFAILVSEWEGQGIVTLEAAASGRPTLLTAVPGSLDLLPPGRNLKNGLEFGNTRQLADTLEEWFADPRRVVQNGELFFRFLKMASDPAAIADKYKEVYRGIVDGSILTRQHALCMAQERNA